MSLGRHQLKARTLERLKIFEHKLEELLSGELWLLQSRSVCVSNLKELLVRPPPPGKLQQAAVFLLLKWPLKTGCILGVVGVDDIQSLHLAEEP